MLSNRELLQHSFFSGLASLAILAGLSAAIHASRAAQIGTSLLGKKLALSFFASISIAIFVFTIQRTSSKTSYFLSTFFIYLPTFIVLAWAIKIYVRNVITIT